jgi:nucleoprotein TPR
MMKFQAYLSVFILLMSAEHERMVEAYALMDQKLQQALLEHDNFESTIRTLKV